MTNRTRVNEPWLSRRHWRRLLDAHAAGRITRDELAVLKRRAARVRTGAPTSGPSRLQPLLRLLTGGSAPRPLSSLSHLTPLEAA